MGGNLSSVQQTQKTALYKADKQSGRQTYKVITKHLKTLNQLIVCLWFKTWDEGLLKNIFSCQRDFIVPPRAQELKLARERLGAICQDTPSFFLVLSVKSWVTGFCGWPTVLLAVVTILIKFILGHI